MFSTLQLKLITKTWHYFDNSKPPVISRARFAVGLFHIYFSHTYIMLNHIQRAVPQQGLEREQVPARAQIGDSKGMPEAVWVAGLDSSLRPQGVDHLPQGVLVETPVALVRKQRRGRKIAILPVD